MKKFVTLIALQLALAGAAFQSAAQSAAPQRSTSVLRIDEMSTPACPALVKAALRKLDGVVKVQASLEQRTATVEYDATKTDLAAIQRVIKQQAGFDSRVAP
jgi:copper chaperone CopZ